MKNLLMMLFLLFNVLLATQSFAAEDSDDEVDCSHIVETGGDVQVDSEGNTIVPGEDSGAD